MCRWSTGLGGAGTLERMLGSAFEERLAGVLAERLRVLREAKGLTQERVAHEAGISRNHYQLLEAGWVKRGDRKPSNPRLGTLIAVSEVLGTSVPELINEMFGGDAGSGDTDD